jgi:hypothetical protein
MSQISTPVNHQGTNNTKRHEEYSVQGVLRVLRGFAVCRRLQYTVVGTLGAVMLTGVTVYAHSGPPFPIVRDRRAGGYQISIWADPDATDDRSAAGQFWVMLQPATAGGSIPSGTRVDVTINAVDRQSDEQSGRAAPVNGDAARQFVALVMDHEGPYGVRVAIDGPLGRADVDASTDATYDLRPRPILMVVFVMPFLLVGLIWGKLLIRRRMHTRGGR